MLKVAIVEDDFRVAQIQERFLSKIKDVKVIGKALNTKETMELLEKEEIDLLLLDIYLPDGIGTDLLPKIHADFPNVDVIMVTAANEKSMLEKAIRNGVCNYLIKPVTLEKFVCTIEDYKRKKQLLNSRSEVNQPLIDMFFGTAQTKDASQKNLPTGVDPLTLQKVKTIIRDLEDGITIEEMGEQMGASRTTARRYLEYLVVINECTVEYTYGIIGRPERKYRLV
ncbi:response regulator [Bacillus pseudomycoides]|uniref:response regulator n=1 Tax=Bacillus pseudomycoides TaxID=64104 RepID=UPI0004ED7CF4|nr:response regulator [Bacillus pseudomycoides]AIK39415.1 transcriptional regulatory protein CitT [Bacillus pseudomycoides]AJI19971.1 response regulator [Bacillus pseudomycoides]